MASLLEPAVLRDPYPYYGELRRTDPVHWDATFAGGGWILTRWEHVHLLLRDRRLSSDRLAVYERFVPGERGKPLLDNLRGWMLYREPPFHTRMRALLARSFTGRTVEALRPVVVSLVSRLLDQAARAPECDAIAQLAYPLPAQVIGALIGVDEGDAEHLKRWSDRILTFAGAIRGVDAAREAIVEMDVMLRRLIAERRRAPRADLLSGLLASSDGGEVLSDDEIVSTCAMLLFAGHHTTMNLIGNGLHALLSDPAALEQFRERPDAAAIEELLRYDSPVQATGRTAVEDLEIGGKQVRKGDFVHLCIGAANRDPDAFADPDRLVLDRADNHHLAFGSGIHFCIGAPLARLEAPLLLAELVRRFPRIRLAGGARLDYSPNVALRGLTTLPVLLS